jgi:hypothetical protein
VIIPTFWYKKTPIIAKSACPHQKDHSFEKRAYTRFPKDYEFFYGTNAY